MNIKAYSRSRFPPEITIPYGQRDLVYTDHALSRMENRTQGSLSILPHMVLLSEKNVKRLWTEQEKGGIEKLRSMKVELPYTRGILLQLIISFDMLTDKLIVITLYFRETWQRTIARCAEDHHLLNIASDTNPGSPCDEVGGSEGRIFPLLTDPPEQRQCGSSS